MEHQYPIGAHKYVVSSDEPGLWNVMQVEDDGCNTHAFSRNLKYEEARAIVDNDIKTKAYNEQYKLWQAQPKPFYPRVPQPHLTMRVYKRKYYGTDSVSSY